VTITSSTTATTFGGLSVPATGVGSGFIYDAKGLILTNYHVVEGSSSLKVALSDGRTLTGTVVAKDASADLAIVKIEATGLPTVKLGSSSGLKVGETVVAIGSPLGEFTGSVTSGILSATGRSITVQDSTTGQARHLTNLLQTDAKINEGNSGGPLLDLQGNVIGINTAAASGADGIGFSIPINAAKSLMTAAASQTGTSKS
jgi:serine protease Do